MTSSEDFRDLQARLAAADHTLFLGRLVWYSVSEVKIAHEALCKDLLTVGLNAYLPRPPSDTDVFRRVCTAAQRKRVPTGDPDVYNNYTVRDVGYDAKTLHKTIVRETVDTKGKKLDHDSEMCKVVFTKATATVQIDCNGTDPVASEMATQIDTDYHAEKGMMNSYGVRELIRRILLNVNATNVRGSGGGVYFVSEEHGDKLDALEKLAELLPGTCMVHSLPLIDDTKQREMLRRAFESESVEEIDRLVDEIAELTKAGKKISKDRYATYLEAFHAAKAKAKEYGELLETSLDSNGSRLKIFQRQVMNLTQLVD